MATINEGGMHQAILSSFDDATQSLKTVVTDITLNSDNDSVESVMADPHIRAAIRQLMKLKFVPQVFNSGMALYCQIDANSTVGLQLAGTGSTSATTQMFSQQSAIAHYNNFLIRT